MQIPGDRAPVPPTGPPTRGAAAGDRRAAPPGAEGSRAPACAARLAPSSATWQARTSAAMRQRSRASCERGDHALRRAASGLRRGASLVRPSGGGTPGVSLAITARRRDLGRRWRSLRIPPTPGRRLGPGRGWRRVRPRNAPHVPRCAESARSSDSRRRRVGGAASLRPDRRTRADEDEDRTAIRPAAQIGRWNRPTTRRHRGAPSDARSLGKRAQKTSMQSQIMSMHCL